MDKRNEKRKSCGISDDKQNKKKKGNVDVNAKKIKSKLM